MTKTKINLHNNYKVKVLGSNGEVRDEGYAENIVLNGFWDRVNDSGYQNYGVNQFTEIRIGTGGPDGSEVDPNRTTLYNQIGGAIEGTNSIVDSNLSNNVRVTSNVMTHTVPATSQYEGEITEVGCGSGGFLNSLALFKDSEGNPISIYKSSEDVMIVEVTVYVVINYAEDFTPTRGMDRISYNIVSNSTNTAGIFDLIGFRAMNIMLTAGKEGVKYGNNFNYNDLGLITENRGQDRVLKDSREVIYDKRRTSDTFGNLGFANYITILNLGSVKLPNNNYFSSYFIEDIEVGEGDGVKTEFNFPIPEFIIDTDKIMVDGVELLRDVDYTLAHDNNSLGYTSSFASMKENCDITGNINPFSFRETSQGEAYVEYEEDIYVESYKTPSVKSGRTMIVSYSTSGENYVEAFRIHSSVAQGVIIDLEEPIEAKYWKVAGGLDRKNNEALAFGKKPTHLVFTNPPAQGAKITATMEVDRPFKSDDFIFDTSFKVSY